MKMKIPIVLSALVGIGFGIFAATVLAPDWLQSYLMVLLPCLGLLAMGIKAVTPGGIELSEGRKMSRPCSIAIGICAILIAILVAGYAFTFLVGPYFSR